MCGKPSSDFFCCIMHQTGSLPQESTGTVVTLAPHREPSFTPHWGDINNEGRRLFPTVRRDAVLPWRVLAVSVTPSKLKVNRGEFMLAVRSDTDTVLLKWHVIEHITLHCVLYMFKSDFT